MLDPNAEVVKSPIEGEQRIAEIEAYWTEERMKRARPRPLPSVSAQGIRAREPEIWPVIQESIPPDEEIVEAIAGATTTKVPPADYRKTPCMKVGKLFMTFNGVDHQGTAWTIAESAVFTAGHCVYTKSEGWAHNLLFQPQYNYGSTPGSWVWRGMYAPRGWLEREDPQYDLAVFTTVRPIRPYTGSLGWIAKAQPNLGPYRALGYPARQIPGFNFDGEAMWQSVGNYVSGEKVIEVYNNMTEGCSGGPWVVTRDGKVYANGLNSHKTSSDTVSSPYFGEAFLNLYNLVKHL